MAEQTYRHIAGAVKISEAIKLLKSHRQVTYQALARYIIWNRLPASKKIECGKAEYVTYATPASLEEIEEALYQSGFDGNLHDLCIAKAGGIIRSLDYCQKAVKKKVNARIREFRSPSWVFTADIRGV